MFLNRIDSYTFAILILSVPLQLYLFKSSFSNSFSFPIKKFISLDRLFSSWLNTLTWISEGLFDVDPMMLGEILLYSPRNEEMQLIVKSKRPADKVLYQIGDVIQHKATERKGVVISWDIEYVEDEEDEDVHKEYVVTYGVLLDMKVNEPLLSEEGVVTQFYQELVNRISGHMITNPETHFYFESFNGERYTPRPWLKKLFPQG